MTVAAITHISRGMPPAHALEIAAQINAQVSDVGKLIGLGISAPLALHMADRITHGQCTDADLMGLGVPGLLAHQLAADIDALPNA